MLSRTSTVFLDSSKTAVCLTPPFMGHAAGNNLLLHKELFKRFSLYSEKYQYPTGRKAWGNTRIGLKDRVPEPREDEYSSELKTAVLRKGLNIILILFKCKHYDEEARALSCGKRKLQHCWGGIRDRYCCRLGTFSAPWKAPALSHSNQTLLVSNCSWIWDMQAKTHLSWSSSLQGW